MKFDLKKKVMLAVLAGNMLCMGQGLAAIYGNVWYGDESSASEWKGATGSYPSPAATITGARASNANLELDGTGEYGEVTFSSAEYFIAGYSTSGAITGNKLTVKSGSNFDSGDCVYAGFADGAGATVSGNVLIIESGSFADSVNISGGGASNTASMASVSNNKVYINGGNFGKVSIYGGNPFYGPASGNIVDIAGGTFNTDEFKLYGGKNVNGSGNTLNLRIKMGKKAYEVGYFQIMNFTLPSGTDDGTPMLKTQTMAFNNTTINVDASAATLNNGDIITLIAYDHKTGNWTAGTITGAEGTITLDGNNIIFTVTGAGGGGGSEDQQKAPVEGIAAAVAMINQSADLASGEGMSSLVANTAGGTDTFGAMSAGSSKYKTGSHVDVDGWGVIVGAGTTKKMG